MALFQELLYISIFILTKPFLLMKLSCIYGWTGIRIVINTWVEILSAAIFFHVNMFWKLVAFTVSLVTLPVRSLIALQKERLLEVRLQQLQDDLDTLLLDWKELQESLQLATKERAMLEVMLTEVEEENDQAIRRIAQLETKLQDLKEENHQLKDVYLKAQLGPSGRADVHYGKNLHVADVIKRAISKYGGSGVALQKVLSNKDDVDVLGINKSDTPDLAKTDGGQTHDLVRHERREVAMSQSIFSATLSLFVGMIIWEAEDPCMPLVVALLTVVCMSLKSVVQFFSAIKNKPASDAIALLSFNMFVLGTLTYPTLPRIARVLSPYAIGFSK